MNDFFDRIASLRPAAKVGIVVGILVVIVGGYWYFWYSDKTDDIDRNNKKIVTLTEEKKSYELRKQQYQAFRLEVNQLLEQQRDLLGVLPKRDDIEQFIENVNAQVELSGLSRVSSVRDAAVTEEMYQRIPIRMSLVGSFHQIARFFKAVGELKRIVNITDLNLTPAPPPQGTSAALLAENQLKADFTAQTFMFLDRGTPAPTKPAGGTP